MLTRRRFIAISAALAPSLALADSGVIHVETGTALGARITLRLQHPDAAIIARQAMTEITRLERIFSLYLADSSLSELNRQGRLAAPPFELLECLGLAGAVHAASEGRFDPTVQPLWQAEAKAREAGTPLSEQERAAARALIGWSRVRLGPDLIALEPGMALTLNGIAQGYIADRIADLLKGQGLTRALIDTGEMVALSEGDWPLQLSDGRNLLLRNRALATSASLGMTFGGDGQSSHILDPKTGRPTSAQWQAISVSAASAALADALSTSGCLFSGAEDIIALCARFDGVRLEAAVPL